MTSCMLLKLSGWSLTWNWRTERTSLGMSPYPGKSTGLWYPLWKYQANLIWVGSVNKNSKCCWMNWRNKKLSANKNKSPRWMTNFPSLQRRRNLQKKHPKLQSEEKETLWTWHRLFIELVNCFSLVGKLWLTATTKIASNILDTLLPRNITDNSIVLPIGISDHCTLEIDTFYDR